MKVGCRRPTFGRNWRVFAWVALVFVTMGCDPKREPDPGASASASASDAGLCEHGVARELCPKCNPDLVTVYQSNGDWCDEHGMPDSFCPICHPERHGRPDPSARPKKSVDANDKNQKQPPADGMKVTLKSDKALEGSGLTTVDAVAAPAKTSARYPVRIAYDATRAAELTPASGGVVRSIRVDIGAKVKAGDTLANLDSAEVGGDRARLGAAMTRLSVAEQHLARLREMEKDGIVSVRERQEAEATLGQAKGDATAFASELGVSGASAGAGASYALRSPIEGVVTQRTAVVGRMVERDQVLFQIVDPSVLWAEIDVPEADARNVVIGSQVALSFPSLPDLPFSATIDVVLPDVDEHTRTVTARASVKNPNGLLRANMFGEAAVLADAPRDGVTIPRATLQSVGGQYFVFVRREALVFEVKHVNVAWKDASLAIVTDGVMPGDAVVDLGAFLLKTETAKDSIGAGCCAND